MYRLLLVVFIQLVFIGINSGQGDTIKLINPSFEDFPRNSHPPRGWYDCGFEGETPPDVQPHGGFEVIKQAQDGGSYLGMVVRDNETWESVSQRLARQLEKGNCYEFSIFLSRSEIYVSQSRVTNETANYVTPAKLRIYGGNGYCGKSELLGETSLVINTRWLEYKFRFEPSDNVSFITLEAFYQTPTLFAYNGNILVDHASDIVRVPCEEKPEPEVPEEKVVNVADQPTIKPEPNENSEPEQPVGDDEPAETAEAKPKILKDLDARNIKEGQTIRIDKLYFAADSSRIKPDSYDVLDEVYQFLTENPNVIVEIGGHTNTIPNHDYCDRLSTERAKAVAGFLVRKGIPEDRLKYKGYGKRKPLTYSTTLQGRKKNQRVEIKILSVSG